MVAVSVPSGTADDLTTYVRREKDGNSHFEAAVSGARCAGCIAKIESGVRAIPGVGDARLNLSTGKLSVRWQDDAAVRPQLVLERVRNLGYQAQPFAADVQEDGVAREGRKLLRCLALSGFATVFVMGLTDAVWYGGDLSPGMRQSFFWLAGMVSVPVTFYAGQPFFASAWSVLKHGRTNMDVPISLALVLALGLSLYQTVSGAPHTYFDAAVMLTFLLLIGRYLDFRLRQKARGAAEHLLAMQSQLARRFTAAGSLETVAARDLRIGDRIFLASGERAPVNGRIDRGTEADLSLVTGESLPVTLAPGAAILSGAVITGAPVRLDVTARAEESLVADLARLLEAGQQSRNRYVGLAQKAAKLYVPLVTSLALLVFLGWLTAGASVSRALTDAIAVLIITCPCALGLAVPAVQVAASGRLFRRGLFIKSGDALERLAEIDIAIFDKTGTLTLGAPVLEPDDGLPEGALEGAARLARASQHPLARALANAAGPGLVDPDVREYPGRGLEAGTGSDARRLGSGAWCDIPGDAKSSTLWFRHGSGPAVQFSFGDRIRPEVPALVQGLGQRGIGVEMLTGDQTAPAAQTARAAGIRQWQAGVTPTGKVEHLKRVQSHGLKALMVGDGLNDAAALALAHVSIAPGAASDVSQLAADMVLRGDSLLPLLEAIDVARKAKSLVMQNFAVAALYNIAAIPLAALGLVSPAIAAATMASSSLLVTLNALRLVRP